MWDDKQLFVTTYYQSHAERELIKYIGRYDTIVLHRCTLNLKSQHYLCNCTAVCYATYGMAYMSVHFS